MALDASSSSSPGTGFGRVSIATYTGRGVTTTLGYLSQAVERPYWYMYQPPNGEASDNCEYHAAPVEIADAREMAVPPSIDAEGFALLDAPTSCPFSHFEDREAIRRLYYPEAIELAKLVTGGIQAFVFDHAVRRRETARPALRTGRDGTGGVLGTVGRAHVDYTEASGQQRMARMAAEHQIQPHPRRYAIVNVWRSIGGKIVDTPLALCDARSVSATDLVAADLLYPDRKGELYLVQASAQHRWAYFSEMDNHEALVFKQYDSQMSGIARFTPHSAFDLPNVPVDAPLRQSIEIRCLVIYE